jgi:photosystem II stability/assembly factor-like uncharacterized protein
MKRHLIFFLTITIVLFFSGCSLTEKKTTPVVDVKIAGNIWKSEDSGKSWQVKNKAAQQLPVSDFDVINITINPNDSQDILVGLKKGGMIRSSDGGGIWKTTSFLPERVYGIEIDPVDSRIIYASGVWQGRGKFWKSENSGLDWNEIYTAPANGPFISGSLLNKFDRNMLFAATSDNQLIKSNDAGTTWKNIFQTDSPVIRMRNDCTNSSIIYMLSLNSRLYRSKNSGENWEDITSKINLGGQYTGIETDPSLSGWFYITGRNGISRTKDFGDTFEKVVVLDNPQAFPVTAMAIHPNNSRELIYAAAQTTYKSDDAGEHWTTFQFNSVKKINLIKYDPTNPNNIYLGLKSQ